MKNICEVVVNKIIENLIRDDLIDNADTEMYRFGIEVTILKIMHYTSYLMIALCINKFFEFAVIFVVFYIFRRNTGGFHAKTRIRCYLFSCATIFLFLFITDLGFSWWEMTIVSVFDLIVLLVLSPVQHSNRKLDTEDIVCFQRRLKVISLIFIIIYAATTGMREMYLIELYTIGVTMVTVLTILGKLQSIK